MTPPATLAWLGALRTPQAATGWSVPQWQHVIRVARAQRLLGRLAEAVTQAGLDADLPPQVQRHLLAERRRSRARLRSLTWTMEQVGAVLRSIDDPIVLLKGAAYVQQGLPIAAGRLPSDLDILVPQRSIAPAQQRLKDHDWSEQPLSAHDQRYYRDWSHEVPPMQNGRFELELDLHHAILPPVARVHVDTDLLLPRLQSAGDGWHVLCPVDQVLHSAAHLFHDSEFSSRLRDLVDLDGLLRHFAWRADFWDDLCARAQQLGLVESLALAVHFTSRWLQTPVPAAVVRFVQRHGPGTVGRLWRHALFEQALLPIDPDARPTTAQRRAATLLLARYHWHRLPPALLLVHLFHKSVQRLAGRDAAAGPASDPLAPP